MTKPLTLYYAPDNASLCVRLALLELRIPFETILVDRAVQGQVAPEYLALNPNGVIPTLMTEDGPIYETGAILMWLAERSNDGFMPKGLSRGSALKWIFWLSNTLHPAMRMWFYPEKFVATEAVPALRARTCERLAGMFAHVEAHASWLNDPAPSALGCYFAPMVRWAALYGSDQSWFDIYKYPKIMNYVQTLERGISAMQVSRAEGLGEAIFSKPSYPNPPEGSAL